MAAVVRYTLLRLLITGGVVGALWLAGVRNAWLLVLLAVLGGALLSPFLLRKQRDEVAAALANRMQTVQQRRDAASPPSRAEGEADSQAQP
jgi:hypothetical protein